MSRLNCGVPIYALTAQTRTRYRCTLLRDIYPLMVKYVGHDREELLAEAESVLRRQRRGAQRATSSCSPSASPSASPAAPIR